MNMSRVIRQIEDNRKTMAGLKKQAGAITRAGELLVAVLRDGGTIYTMGNGGSAAEALHMAEELTGRYRSDRRPLPAAALVADSTALTCIGNDFGFAHVFSRQVEALGRRGDAAVFFSTSGRSPNLIRAFGSAARLGMRTICLLGRGGGRLAGKAEVEVVVGSEATGRVQEAHQLIMHILLEFIEDAFASSTTTKRRER